MSSYFIYVGDKSSSVGSGVIKEERCTLIMLYTSLAVWMEFFSEIPNLSRVAAYIQQCKWQERSQHYLFCTLILHVQLSIPAHVCVCVVCVVCVGLSEAL